MLDDKIYMIGGWKNQKMEMLDLNQPFQWKDMKSTTEPFIHSASAVSNGELDSSDISNCRLQNNFKLYRQKYIISMYVLYA